MRRFLILLLPLLLADCSTAPDVELDEVEMNQITERIKCELAFAVADRAGEYPGGNLQWLKYWTAKVDLQLEATNVGTVQPNINIIEPLTTIILPGVGSFPRNFTLGASGKLEQQAQSTDTTSFTLSIDELPTITALPFCQDATGRGLLGNLGLQVWINSALAPARSGELSIGFHEGPTGSKLIGGKLPGPTGSGVRADGTASDYLNDSRKAVRDAEDASASTFSEALKAESAAKAQKQGRWEIQKIYNLVDIVYGNINKINSEIDSAEQALWNAERSNREMLLKVERNSATKIGAQIPEINKLEQKEIEVIESPGDPKFIADAAQRLKERNYIKAKYKDLVEKTTATIKSESMQKGFFKEDEFKKQVESIRKDIEVVTKRATKAGNISKAAWELMPRDPPLDSISHQVKFVVTKNGTVNPNWTLVRFKGPGLAPPFASASRTSTHTLTIVLGQPATVGGKALGDEQRRQLLNRKLESLRFISTDGLIQ